MNEVEQFGCDVAELRKQRDRKWFWQDFRLIVGVLIAGIILQGLVVAALASEPEAIDIGTDKLPHRYSHHVQSRWQQHGNKIVWELAIDIYTDDYVDGSDKNVPVKLSAGKVMGLMSAWCDTDGSELRENFIGSESAPGENKDRGWIDAGLFGSLMLVE